VISITLLGGCIPSLTNDTEVVKETEENDVETTIIPSMQLSDQFYRTLLPYEESASRGLIVSNIHSKYDLKEVENGLIRLSQRSFSTNDYFFQEGQTLDADTLSLWLARSSQDDLPNPTTKKCQPNNANKSSIYRLIL
jgi:protein involved in sex pheromone biosynthesis